MDQSKQTKTSISAMSTKLASSFITLLWLYASPIAAGRQAMKVVVEPSNYGMNFGAQNLGPEETVLKLRVPPAKLSGPSHLRNLQGRCYNLVTGEYKYEFCPFSNMTQYEQSLRWNPYSGILGVWQEWEIENNTFVAMLFKEGDKCGSTPRTVRVLLLCGNKTELVRISEPTKCAYEAEFRTTLACHPNALRVYPTLPEKLRHEWDVLETQYQLGEITHQGYRKFLRSSVLEPVGLVLPPARLEALAQAAEHVDEVKAREAQGEYDTLDQCTEELKKLKDKIKKYQEILDNNGINPETGNNERDELNDHPDRMGDGADMYDSHGDYFHGDI